MSCYVIYYKDRAKYMRPVLTKEEYLQLRNSEQNRSLTLALSKGDGTAKSDAKRKLVQMNYSCLPNDDGTLKGSTRMSMTVGMDVDLPEAEVRNGSKVQEVQDRILAKKDEVGLLMMEHSATKGFHIVFRRHPELTQEENLHWASEVLDVEFDKGAKDITRVFYTPADKLIFLDEELFRRTPAQQAVLHDKPSAPQQEGKETAGVSTPPHLGGGKGEGASSYLGLPYSSIISKWWEMYNDGQEPVESNRDVLTFELAVNLRHICGFSRQLLDKVIPCYDGFPETQKLKCIDSALAEKRTQMPKRLKDVLFQLQRERMNEDSDYTPPASDGGLDDLFYYNRIPKSTMVQGVKDSIDAVGPSMAMPVLLTICPIIGMLATGVRLVVHGLPCGLNLVSYIVGNSGSGKGSIDPIVSAWMKEIDDQDDLYFQQEQEWARRKKKAKNAKEQPEEIFLPVRNLALNNTVANIAQRLQNTQGKHSFSFTPEADTVALKWRQSISDFSVMIRQAYDGSRYDREAKSVDAVSVHIKHLLWNVVMCGTPDALYRVVTNYTDGFLSRLAIARTPDNTFAPLSEHPYILSERGEERIHQVAHLLPLLSGTVNLPKLEQTSREWVEDVRLQSMKNDDKVMAKCRLRDHVIAMRMTACVMLCWVVDKLISKYGVAGAETRLRTDPEMWKRMMLQAQRPQMMELYKVIADSLVDNDLYFFRDKLEGAIDIRTAGNGNGRFRPGKNDNIFGRLASEFTFEQAYQQSLAVKGGNISNNSVRQMLKNWIKQGLIDRIEFKRFKKLE